MAKRSKRHNANLGVHTQKTPLPLEEALELIKNKFKPVKFDETVEIALQLGVDVKKSDQMVRGAVSLPRGIGKELRVVVFCKEDRAQPSPKSGTVTKDIAAAVTEYKAGKIEFRADSGGNVHAPMGKRSFPKEALAENINTFVAYVKSIKPAAARGQYILNTSLSTTMGPGIPVDLG